MNKIKNSSNKGPHVHEPSAKAALHHAIEKKLIPRLRVMGFILFAFSLCSLSYAYFSMSYDSPFDDDGFLSVTEETAFSGFSFEDDPASPPFELTPGERLNFYIVAAIFAAVGIGCLAISKKKQREHLSKEI